VRVKKAKLQGKITLPSSKSQTLRAILFAAMASGGSEIHLPLFSPDAYAMMEACRYFGAKIEVKQEYIEIAGIGGKIISTEDVIQAGNSGIVLRFCSALGALGNHPIVVTGDHSIRHLRPMKPLLHGLRQLGAKADSMRGDELAPVIIQGPIREGKALINGEDSQPVSALLIASAFADRPIELEVINPGEKPWVALTLSWFKKLGIFCANRDFTHFKLNGNAHYEGFAYDVPGDLSTAAFPLAAALITDSEIIIENVDMQEEQGDKELIYLLQKMGGRIEIDERAKCLHVRKGSKLRGVEADLNNFVDALPILSVMGCYAEGETRIVNAAVAKTKECDRIMGISSELKKMGGKVEARQDGLLIQKSELRGAQLESYRDHRMAMSLAVAAMGAKGEAHIANAECVSKTFPAFIAAFNSLGAGICVT
jgi:3-phosphoshikimate 1-carboxyvinyltransferase